MVSSISRRVFRWYRIADETVTRRPYNASEVFVTGTFDDWGKTVKLDRVGDVFLKKVTISPVQKVHYKVRNKNRHEKKKRKEEQGPLRTRVDCWR